MPSSSTSPESGASQALADFNSWWFCRRRLGPSRPKHSPGRIPAVVVPGRPPRRRILVRLCEDCARTEPALRAQLIEHLASIKAVSGALEAMGAGGPPSRRRPQQSASPRSASATTIGKSLTLERAVYFRHAYDKQRTTVRFQPASDQSLLVYFGERITPQAHRSVMRLLRLLESEPVDAIRNLHPAYCSLLVKFDALKLGHAELEAILLGYLERLEQVRLPEPRQVEIPSRATAASLVRTLNDVAADVHGMTDQPRSPSCNASAIYSVYFLGFVPGFAYLGGLPEHLATPRLATPRRKASARQRGHRGQTDRRVYPFAVPAGWRLIGCTPTAMFRPERADVSLLSIGDRVKSGLRPSERFAEMQSLRVVPRRWRPHERYRSASAGPVHHGPGFGAGRLMRAWACRYLPGQWPMRLSPCELGNRLVANAGGARRRWK